MLEKVEALEKGGYGEGKEDYTQDGTTDLKGNPILRSKTGRWKATSFIVGYEVFERMAYYGIATNLVLYLTRELNEGTVKSSNNVTNWIGTLWMTPLLGAYIADAHLGRYWTFMISSAIYLAEPAATTLFWHALDHDLYLIEVLVTMVTDFLFFSVTGNVLIDLAVSMPALKPPSCAGGVKPEDCDKRASSFQIGIFYCALYIIALGTGGTKPNISTMGADQFDASEPKERVHKLSFFNWWMFSIFFGTLFSNTFLVYIQDNVGWAIRYAVPKIGLMVAVAMFIVGTPNYRHKPPSESPLTRMVKVLVAAVRKWNVVVPNDPNELYELSLDEYSNPGKYRIDHTYSIRFLDKAAVKNSPTSPWMLRTVTQVEETKQMVKMLPVLVASFIPTTLFAQTHTLFVKQGTTLIRSMGPNFDIPRACLTAFVTLFMLISIVVYDRFFVPAIRHYTKNPRGITLLQRMGIGIVLHVIIMIIASFTERYRLRAARENVAKIDFFYDQAPEAMKSLGTALYTTSFGVGYFLSSFLLSTVADITKSNGHKGWILDNLNVSHLDYYYAFYAVLSFLNLHFFLVVSKYFVYNTEKTEAIGPSPDQALTQEDN